MLKLITLYCLTLLCSFTSAQICKLSNGDESCCPGYSWDGTTCVSNCNRECINAFCVTKTCNCKFGFKFNAEKSNATTYVCQPECRNNCTHGYCVAPNKCECEAGYVEGEERKQCVPECGAVGCGEHGTCIAPGVCQCNIGYAMNVPNICEPICAQACVHGKCIAPEVCECETGFVLSEEGVCVTKGEISAGARGKQPYGCVVVLVYLAAIRFLSFYYV